MKIRAVDLLEFDEDQMGEQSLECIDQKKLDAAIEWFVKLVIFKQKQNYIDFYKGYLKEAYGFKQEIYASAHSILNLEAWTRDMVGSHKILDRVLAGMISKERRSANAMMDIHEIKEFKKQAEMDLDLAEDILFRMYKKEPETVFDDACFLLGRNYHIFSYILFTRDCTKYLPVEAKKNEHYDCFVKIGAETDGIMNCTWRGYRQFLKVHEEVRKKLEESFNTHITLLDAHSFILTLRDAPEDFSFEWQSELEEYAGGKDELYDILSELIFTKDYGKENAERSQKIEDELTNTELSEEERRAVLGIRINNDPFEKKVHRRYGKCCLCRIHDTSLLSVHNLKPWKECEPEERFDIDNGFMFCPNHGRLFDVGLISFTDDGTIMISKDLDEVDRVYVNVRPNMRIEIRDGNRKYLDYHRKNIFADRKQEIIDKVDENLHEQASGE